MNSDRGQNSNTSAPAGSMLVMKSKTHAKRSLAGLALASLAIALLLVLSIGTRDCQANPVALASDSSLQQSSSAGDYNNLDNLISEFLDDRLKKSKQNSVRQVKQTLRFGRRSDPLMMSAAILESEESGGLFGRRSPLDED